MKQELISIFALRGLAVTVGLVLAVRFVRIRFIIDIARKIRTGLRKVSNEHFLIR